MAFLNRSSDAQGGAREIVNLEEVLQQCRRWQLPQGTHYTSVACEVLDDFQPDQLAETIAIMRRTQALVSREPCHALAQEIGAACTLCHAVSQ